MALLTTRWFVENYGKRSHDLASSVDVPLSPLILPDDGSRLSPRQVEQIEVAFFHGDFRSDPAFTRRFFGTALHAPKLRWMHLPNSGVDDPVFARLRANGVRLTTSPDAAAEPIAHSAIAGMLALARGFPHWIDAQRRRAWEEHPAGGVPRDLPGQTVVLLGVGAIGERIGRLAHAFGLHVIGVRRRPGPSPDVVDETVPPSSLAEVLPRADWLVIACPLTEETRGWIDAAALARLRPHARIINVARGPIVDERALIEALHHGAVAGAYLDVFEREPLPADSPLWDLPNVLISPHDSGASTGNAFRASELFLRNLERWLRGDALHHEVTSSDA
jgi:phosphoglycerate dehydrogenase-like enzyme